MYIHGEFVNKEGKTILLMIVTNGDESEELEIGSDDSGLFFTDDPIEISSEVNDTFDVLLRTSATVRLYCREFMGELFQKNCRNAIVNIYRDDDCIFAGFIEPMAYSQGYNEIYDELELNCIDALSALQYSYYGGAGANGVTYAYVKSQAGRKTLYKIIEGIFGEIYGDLALGTDTGGLYYDGSIGLTSDASAQYSIFHDLSVSDLVFIGDEEEDLMKQDEVLEECLRYLNLHIAQRGTHFYIFSWDSVKKGNAIEWKDFYSISPSITTAREIVTLSGSNVADCDTTISIGDVYNVISVTCDTDSVENVLSSPLDDDSLISPFSQYQKYVTEYSSDGEGEKAYRAFYNMVHGNDTTYGGAEITDWFMQIKSNALWKFYLNGSTDVIETYCADGKNQHLLLDAMGGNRGAAIVSIGKLKSNMAKDDNSPTTRIDRTDYLVMTVNGNLATEEAGLQPTDDEIKACIPYAEYTGKSGGVFSPADDDTTNYIVFSGSMVLNPVMEFTDAYGGAVGIAELRRKEWTRINGTMDPTTQCYLWHDTVPSRNNKDGRYYVREYWQAENPTDSVTTHDDVFGFYPFTGEGPEKYTFKYSSVGDKTDTISKVGLVACMLVIGDKCCVEKPIGEDLGTGIPGTGNGQLTDFVWQTYKPLSECADEDEYYQQSFTLGIDPAIGDKLVGTEFDIQTNFDYTVGLSADKGTAIPITKADKVSGDVLFKILGPVNAVWDEITRRHPTFFRHTKWGTNSVALLAQTSSIMLKSFEVKAYSAGEGESDDDGDIVYTSDTDESFINVKDDITFKMCSALTSAECKEIGVKNEVRLSTVVETSTGDGVLSVHDFINNRDGKPEQLYVDRYYNECHEPRVLMEQNIRDTGDGQNIFTLYKHEAMGKSFFIYGQGYELMEGTISLKLKEIDD